MPLQPSGFEQREFPMTAENFATLQQCAYDSTGIKLTEHKKEMVYSRVARRIRQLRLGNFDEYCALVEDLKHSEHDAFVNIITTNLTSFYRENHHFEFFRSTVIPWLQNKNQFTKKLRIWSAGCSSGEEPYTLAAVIQQSGAFRYWDIKILATDLDSDTLNKGRVGKYSAEKLDNLSDEQYKSLFARSEDGAMLNVKDELKSLIHFKRLNLMENPWPMSGPFDVLFCRNVVIYFDKDTQKQLFERYANLMVPDGYLFIGHSESLNGVSDRFKVCGKTIYRKVH
jgi:chemotaxis protein methyltransferase CheR